MTSLSADPLLRYPQKFFPPVGSALRNQCFSFYVAGEGGQTNTNATHSHTHTHTGCTTGRIDNENTIHITQNQFVSIFSPSSSIKRSTKITEEAITVMVKRLKRPDGVNSGHVTGKNSS